MQNVQKVKYFDKKTFKGSKITQKARNFLFLACRKIQWTRKELESFGLEFSYFNTCFSKYSYCICLKSKKSINIKKLKFQFWILSSNIFVLFSRRIGKNINANGVSRYKP